MTYKKPSHTKSIVEESSSVLKAIEKAWNQVGKPAEFTVKVLETEQKNFLGMSVKPAKVSIFFQDMALDPREREGRERGRPERVPRHERDRSGKNEKGERAPRHERPQRTQQMPREESRGEKREHVHEEARRTQQSSVQRWSDGMINDVRAWLETTLKILGKDVPFTTQTQNYCLKIIFAQQLFADNEKERAFYRLASYLIMQALRTSLKEGFRGFKIIMSVAQ